MEIKRLEATNSILITSKNAGAVVNCADPSKINVRMVAWTKKGLTAGVTTESQVVLAGAGSYEVAGIEAQGVSAGDEDGVIYVFLVDGVSVCVLPALHEGLSDKKIEKLEEMGVDVCVVDLMGEAAVKSLLENSKRMGANYVIPVGTSEQIGAFLNAADVEGKEAVDKLKVDSTSLPDGLEVVLLSNG